MERRFALAAAGVSLGFVSPVLGVDVTLPGLAEDYHITLPEGNAPINTSNGIGMDATRLGVFGEFRDPPMGGRPNAERRAIIEFDLAGLLPFGNEVTGAEFSIFLPDQNSSIPTRDLDLYGATLGRPAPIAFDSAGAADEFDSPGYSLLDAAFLEDITPLDYEMRFGTDVAGFIAARYAEFLADASRRYVLFRLQIQNNDEGANAFYEFSSAEDAADRVPRLTVTVVPAPPAAGVVGAAVFVMAGVRRRRGTIQRGSCTGNQPFAAAVS